MSTLVANSVIEENASVEFEYLGASGNEVIIRKPISSIQLYEEFFKWANAYGVIMDWTIQNNGLGLYVSDWNLRAIEEGSLVGDVVLDGLDQDRFTLYYPTGDATRGVLVILLPTDPLAVTRKLIHISQTEPVGCRFSYDVEKNHLDIENWTVIVSADLPKPFPAAAYIEGEKLLMHNPQNIASAVERKLREIENALCASGNHDGRQNNEVTDRVEINTQQATKTMSTIEVNQQENEVLAPEAAVAQTEAVADCVVNTQTQSNDILPTILKNVEQAQAQQENKKKQKQGERRERREPRQQHRDNSHIGRSRIDSSALELVRQRMEANKPMDGVNFINLNFTAETELGKRMHMTAKTPFIHPDFGEFSCLMGFQLWILSRSQHDWLRQKYSGQAKHASRDIEIVEFEGWQQVVADALWHQVNQNPEVMQLMIDNTLPYRSVYHDDRIKRLKDTAEGKVLVPAMAEIDKVLKRIHQSGTYEVPDFSKLFTQNNRRAN